MWTADQLHMRLGLTTNAGADESEILDFERKYDLKLPAELRALLSESDGATHPELYFSLLSLSALPDWMNGGARMLLWQRFGYVPVVDFGESNPHCVCCRGPLTGFVVQVQHDDAPDVCFRTLGEFLNGLEAAVRAGDLDHLESPFDRNERTVGDVEAARQLLVLANQLDDERDIVCQFGITLLADVDEILPWHDDRSEYVRRDAAQRLRQLNLPAAQAAIVRQEAAFREFVARCSQLLTAEGFGCSIQNGKDLKVTRVPESVCAEAGLQIGLFQKLLDKSPLGLNTSALFGQRADDGFEAWFVQRVKELAVAKIASPF